jgi:hypothetical protein
MGYVTRVPGTTILAASHNTEYRDQVVSVFASIAARDAAITSPVRGMMCFITATGRYYSRSATAWRELGIADSQLTVRQYRTGFTGSAPVTIANTAGAYTVTFNGNEIIDTDSMAASPITSLTLSEGVWAINVSVSLIITTGAASTWNIPTNTASPYLSIIVGGVGVTTSPMPSSIGNNIVASTGATYSSSSSVVIPVAAGTVVSVTVSLPTPAITGTVTTQLQGTQFQAVQIG